MRTRVLAQSSRMNDLVEQLLVLARLDTAANSEGAHPATKEGDMGEVDLGEIVLDAAADAAVALAAEDWASPETAPLVVASCPQPESAKAPPTRTGRAKPTHRLMPERRVILLLFIDCLLIDGDVPHSFNETNQPRRR